MPYSRVWVINLVQSTSSPEPALPSSSWTGNGRSRRIQNRNLKILVRFNCARVKLFTNLTKRSSWGNLALLAHCYNLIVSKQFFFLSVTSDRCIYSTEERTRKDCSRRPKKNVAIKTFVRHRDTLISKAVGKFKRFSIMYESQKKWHWNDFQK